MKHHAFEDSPSVSTTFTGLMQILELVKRNPSKLLLVTLNDLNRLDEQMIDRIEVKICFELPSTEHKYRFLSTNYHLYLSKKMCQFAANNSIGYNYRDLPELIKLAYRLGHEKINMRSLTEAMRIYYPTQLYEFDVFNAVDTKLENIIGKPQAMTTVKRVVEQYKNESLNDRMGLRRGNLLLFHGPPGTGKSFMARAIAGEIGFPLISVQMRNLCDGGPFQSIDMILDMAKRYRNCVIFIDEADKFLGRESYGEDTAVLGELHRCLDGVDAQEIQSILILAANDVTRFGETLLDRFVLVPFELPSFDDRLVYFKGKIDKVSKQMKCEFTSQDLATRTEQMTYREMDRVWNDAMFLYLENHSCSAEDILSRVTQRYADRSSGEMMFL